MIDHPPRVSLPAGNNVPGVDLESAESALLGCSILDPTLISDLREEWLLDPRHVVIARALLRLRAGGHPVDVSVLVDHLSRAGQLDAAGGLGYIAGLPDRTPSASTWSYWVGIARRQSDIHRASRVLAEATDEIARRPELARAIVSTARTALGAIALDRDGLDVIDATVFVRSHLPMPAVLVHGILRRGDILSLGGSSKSCKSWVLLDLAVSTACGVPWLDIPTERARVLLVNLEVRDCDMRRRVELVCAAKGVTLDPGQLAIVNCRGDGETYLSLLPKLRSELDARPRDLVIIDPMYSLLGEADENSARDMNRMLSSVMRLSIETGAAIATAAHFAKGNAAGKEQIDRVSGSGVIARNPDAIVTLTEHEEQDAYTIEATLRNFQRPKPRVLRWSFPLMTTDENLDPTALKRPARTQSKPRGRPQQNPLDLLFGLAQTTVENPVSIATWAGELGMTRTALLYHLPGLRRQGWIATVGEGNKSRQHITEAGLAALEKTPPTNAEI
jgi:hypothetical protein